MSEQEKKNMDQAAEQDDPRGLFCMGVCAKRGIGQEEAVSLIVNGFCKEVMQQLPMEFAIEAAKLINITLEGSVG